MLLQSDLRGHVEDAAWYLRTPRREDRPARERPDADSGDGRNTTCRRQFRGEINVTHSPTRWKSICTARRSNPLEMARESLLAGVMANVLHRAWPTVHRSHRPSTRAYHITGIEWADGACNVIGALNKKDISRENIYSDF